MLAAGNICTASGEDKDVCEGAGSGCCSEENEVGGYSKGGLSCDDSVMLREVGKEDSEEDDADG